MEGHDEREEEWRVVDRRWRCKIAINRNTMRRETKGGNRVRMNEYVGKLASGNGRMNEEAGK